ncbi:DHS-like NAD/FAD-binding domain-containing protein [Daldinia grandis]|nr:DHS-like NAD/FAD-binding domain-containing protein [Daldinia grandis]
MESAIKILHLTQVRPESTRELQAIADAILRSSNIVVITGAGISTNAGIPDYCSMDRYYHTDDETSKEAKAQKIKTKDLFHSTALSNKTTQPHFLSYHTRLRQLARERKPTLTHYFIRELCVRGQLIRNYTQNIDDQERKAGLCTDLQRGTGTRRGEGGVECVQLHGSLRFLRCSYCNMQVRWHRNGRETATMSGQQPVCPACSRVSKARIESGKRASNPGALRPDIVLYDEVHPRADEITDIKIRDLTYGNANVLLILGTRLRIKGVKDMVKEFARSVHERDGLVVYVNLTAPKAKGWDGVIDYWVECDCDSWVKDLKRRGFEGSPLISKREKKFREDSDFPDIETVLTSKKRHNKSRGPTMSALHCSLERSQPLAH